MSLPQIGSLVILAALSTVIVDTQTASTRPSQPVEALGRNILSQLVGFNTTSERGSTQAAQAVAARALAAGFPERDVTVVAPTGHPDKASVVIRLRGRSSTAPVLYIKFRNACSTNRGRPSPSRRHAARTRKVSK